MILTPDQFNRIRTLGMGLPQTTVGPAKAVPVGLIDIDSLDLVSVPWLCMHVIDLVGIVRYGNLITASKASGSPAALTTDAAFFSSADVGSTVTWATGQQTYITGYTSPTSVTVTNVAGLTAPVAGALAGYFTLQPSVPDIINNAFECAVCGLVSLAPEQFDLPGGCPESIIMTSKLEVLTASPFEPRQYSGPGRLALSVANNTRNFDLKVAVNAAMRCTRGV